MGSSPMTEPSSPVIASDDVTTGPDGPVMGDATSRADLTGSRNSSEEGGGRPVRRLAGQNRGPQVTRSARAIPRPGELRALTFAFSTSRSQGRETTGCAWQGCVAGVAGPLDPRRSKTHYEERSSLKICRRICRTLGANWFRRGCRSRGRVPRSRDLVNTAAKPQKPTTTLSSRWPPKKRSNAVHPVPRLRRWIMGVTIQAGDHLCLEG